jgi:hypothetical protein
MYLTIPEAIEYCCREEVWSYPFALILVREVILERLVIPECFNKGFRSSLGLRLV